MNKLIFLILFSIGCQNNCPCGSVGTPCEWNYYYIDDRPQCKNYARPAPCPFPEKNGICNPPKIERTK